jgi:hypothetical protein
MVTLIEQHPETHGLQPICAVLAIASSTYFLRKAQEQDPSRRIRPERTSQFPAATIAIAVLDFHVYRACGRLAVPVLTRNVELLLLNHTGTRRARRRPRLT